MTGIPIQAPGAVYHAGYVVSDLDAAIRHWAEKLGAGPFFLFEGFRFTKPKYRGQDVGPEVTLAFAFSGDFCVELIQQTDQAPSIYREPARTLHHLGIAVPALDAALRPYEAAGVEVAFRGGFPFGGGCAYLDTVDNLGFMVELVERTEAIDQMLAGMKSAHLSWNRRDYTATFS